MSVSDYYKPDRLPDEFRKLYLNEWKPDPLLALAKEYEDRCEAFDVTIGMGGNDRSKWTACNYVESSRNARLVLVDIVEREGVPKSELLKAIRQFHFQTFQTNGRQQHGR